jgi:threonine dehydrogenase-like Zn-dependent dehydrogenase
VIAIDAVPERLALAEKAGALTLNFRDHDIYENIKELTKGRGADSCIDAVGTEADTTACSPSGPTGHVWTTPAMQEKFGVLLAVGCKSCVRPVRAAYDRWP